MDTDPILRVFGRAAESHRAMLSSAGDPPAVKATSAAPSVDALHRGTQTSESTEDATGMLLPSPASRQRFVHHGYHTARQEQEEWRIVAGAEAREVAEASEAAESADEQATSPQPGAGASAVVAAERAAKLAWQQAAQAAQSAAEQHAGRSCAESQQQLPGVSGVANLGWPFGSRSAAGQEPPPQPPPPPNFALHDCAATSTQHSSGSTGRDPQMWAPAAGAPEPGTQTTAGSNGAMASDEELAGLLTAWYNAGYETGRHHEKRRLQTHMQEDAAIPQTVH